MHDQMTSGEENILTALSEIEEQGAQHVGKNGE